MAVAYTYGQGTSLSITNSGSADSVIYVYNYDVDDNQIIPINGSRSIALSGGASIQVALPALTAANQSTYASAGLFFAQSPLAHSLEVGSLPDIGNPSVDGNIAFTEFEYAYVLPNAPYVRGGLNPDFTAVDAFSYPLQWSVTDPNQNSGTGQTFTWGLGGSAQYHGNGASLSAVDLLRAWMAATPFVDPLNGKASSLNTTDNLFWQDDTDLNNNRVVGPSKLWNYGSGGSPGLPASFPSNYSTFVTQFPYDGDQLAQAGAFGTPSSGSPLNNDGWQIVTPVQMGGTGIENGYTYSLQQTATALGGITSKTVSFQDGQQILPNQGSGGFQGFYSYPQENILGGITYLADQVTTSINVGPLSSSLTIGTGDQDKIVGTIASDVMSGGYNADRLTGQPSSDSLDGLVVGSSRMMSQKAGDVYLYLRADSSLHGKNRRDVITDFHRNDRLDLAAVDANANRGGKQSFQWIGRSPFSGQAGQLRIDQRSSGNAFLQGDIDGNGRVDFEVKMLGVDTFQRSNLNLL